MKHTPKRLLLATVITGLCCFSAFAQKRPVYPQNMDIHVMPIALVHPDPSLRLGVEYMGVGRWGFGLSAGTGAVFPSAHISAFPIGRKTNHTGYSMFEIRPEIKFYWLQRRHMGWYLAVEGVAMTRKNRFFNERYFLEDEVQIHFEAADFRKNKLGAIGKIGAKFLVGPRLTIDLFSGLGVALTDVTYSNIQNPVEQYFDPFFEGENFYPGKRPTGLLTVGVKLGFRLWE